jgi:hypothetical protein
MEIKKWVLGPEHPDTRTSMNNLTFIWKGQGRAEEALSLMEECVRCGTSCLGTYHPATKSSLEALKQWCEEGAN